MNRVRSVAGLEWLVFFGAILGAWALLYAMAVPAELREASRLFGAEFWISLCTVTPDAAGFAQISVMWLLMSAAMMLPSAIPAFTTYSDLRQSASEASIVPLAAGFLAAWLGFSLLAAGLQISLFQLQLVSSFGDSRSHLLSALLLLVAGLYQFTDFKQACLAKCRAPFVFFMQHWAEGPWRNGLRLGATCVGCCWALMLLAFVGGMTSLAFMGLATLIMTLEKLPDIGRWLSYPLGFALIGAAGVTTITGF